MGWFSTYFIMAIFLLSLDYELFYLDDAEIASLSSVTPACLSTTEAIAHIRMQHTDSLLAYPIVQGEIA